MTSELAGRLFTRRALGLGLLALVLMAVMSVLGLWQLGVYDQHQQADSRSRLDRPATPLEKVLGPDEAFPADAVSQPVTVTGRYLLHEQFEVHHSPLLDASDAVVTPLQVAGGSVILVVRGAGGATVAAPTGEVSVSGLLEPSDATGSSPKHGRVSGGLQIAALVQGFPQDLYGGYVVMTSSHPADPVPSVSVPLPAPSRWTGIRNLMYAVQWWLFAVFVAFMWWRILTEPQQPVEPVGAYGGDPSNGLDSSAGSTRRSTPPGAAPTRGRRAPSDNVAP